MTILPDMMIRKHIFKCAMIEPFDEDQLQPASYDVRLASKLQVPSLMNTNSIDLGEPESIRDRNSTFDMDSKGYVLQSNRFVLASTIEKVDLPTNIVGRIEGKSSLARLGIQIHSAGYLDPGFRGNVTLEIVNFNDLPIILRPGVLIAQLSFAFMSEHSSRPYKGRYQDSEGTIESRYHKDGDQWTQ